MSQQVIIGKQPHVRNRLPSQRRQPKIELSRSQPRALQDLSTWMRASGNEMVKSELMTGCLPARCDLQMDFKTFPTTIAIQAAYPCYLHTEGHFRGKQVAFFLAVPLSRYEVSPNSLAWSVVSAMHLSVPSTPISSSANQFRNNESAISIRCECCASPGLVLGSRIRCAGWSLAGGGGQDGFQEDSGVLRWGDETQGLFGLVSLLSTTARAGCLQGSVGQDIPGMWESFSGMCLVTTLTTTQVRCLYIRVA